MEIIKTKDKNYKWTDVREGDIVTLIDNDNNTKYDFIIVTPEDVILDMLGNSINTKTQCLGYSLNYAELWIINMEEYRVDSIYRDATLTLREKA